MIWAHGRVFRRVRPRSEGNKGHVTQPGSLEDPLLRHLFRSETVTNGDPGLTCVVSINEGQGGRSGVFPPPIFASSGFLCVAPTCHCGYESVSRSFEV